MKNPIILVILFTIYTRPNEGKILRVIDGDTFVLQTEEGSMKIRMDGIDAPESDQEFGMEAKEFLNQFLYKNVRVFPIGVDKYGRTIGTLYVGTVNINLLELREGMPGIIKSIRVIRS